MIQRKECCSGQIMAEKWCKQYILTMYITINQVQWSSWVVADECFCIDNVRWSSCFWISEKIISRPWQVQMQFRPSLLRYLRCFRMEKNLSSGMRYVDFVLFFIIVCWILRTVQQPLLNMHIDREIDIIDFTLEEITRFIKLQSIL